MLIRKEQMAVLDAYMNDKFIKKLITHIQKDFPAECEKYSLNENTLEPFVKDGLDRAKKIYGIENKDDLTFFIECMVLLAPDFDQNGNFPWVAEILQDKDLSATEKMDEIDQYMLFNLESPI